MIPEGGELVRNRRDKRIFRKRRYIDYSVIWGGGELYGETANIKQALLCFQMYFVLFCGLL